MFGYFLKVFLYQNTPKKFKKKDENQLKKTWNYFQGLGKDSYNSGIMGTSPSSSSRNSNSGNVKPVGNYSGP